MSVTGVTDPALIVIEDPEARAAAVAAAAVAGASVHVRLALRHQVPLSKTEVTETALPWVVIWPHAILALPPHEQWQSVTAPTGKQRGTDRTWMR